MENDVIISRKLYNSLKQLSHNSSEEICAVLLGHGNRIISAVFTENISHSPVLFDIAPETLVESFKKASILKLNVLGIFHSHPQNHPYASARDHKFMKSNGGIWIIYSPKYVKQKTYITRQNITVNAQLYSVDD
jgi:proteasome lid subunit RPN8/RPN11